MSAFDIAVIDAKPYASDMDCFIPLMEKYKTNPYRITNFNRDEQGNLACPNGKKFIYKYDRHIRGNKYGRTEEDYECEDCEGCPYRSECCKRETGNRSARLNRELTSFHEEVINNLETIHGALPQYEAELLVVRGVFLQPRTFLISCVLNSLHSQIMLYKNIIAFSYVLW